MRLHLLLFCILSAILAIAANCTNTDTCAACPATKGSLTFAAIANTAYTSPAGTTIASTDCITQICVDSLNSCNASSNCSTSLPAWNCMQSAFAPHGVALSSLFWINCWHGGGGYSGFAYSCFGPSSGITTTPVIIIQQYLDKPNPVGGKGVGIILWEYPWSNTTACENCGGNFPVQFQAVACDVSWVMSGALGFVPTTLGYYGPSWGGELAFWAGNVPTRVYGASSTCLSPDARPAQSRTVSAWAQMSWFQPYNSSSYTNNGSANVITALNGQFGTSTYATGYTADLAAAASPYLQITGANLSQIQSNQQMFQFTSTDQVVEPSWSGGGNMVVTVQQYQALGITPMVVIYPDGPSGCNNYNSLGGHEICLGNLASPNTTMNDAFNFLLNVPGASGAGSFGSGVIALMFPEMLCAGVWLR